MCRILESSWALTVLCNCRQRQVDPCKFTCRMSSCTALGYSLLCGTGCGGTTSVQPSTLTKDCRLKLPPPPHHSLPIPPSIFVRHPPGVLSNARVWCRTWANELLSLTVWLQVATLSGYIVKHVKKVARSAVVCGLSISPHEASCTVRYLYDVVPHPRCCAITFCLHWLRTHAL